MNWHEYEYHAPRPHIRFGPKLTPTVKTLITINVVVFVFQSVLARTPLFFYLCVVPRLLFRKLFLWQLFTYMFLHANLWHILLNMFVLWMFGSELEVRLGRKQFIQLYFLSGLGAGLCYALTSWGPRAFMPMLGASGAVFGLLVAYAMLFPERYLTLLVFFVFPVTLKAKHLVLGFALLEILSVVSVARDNVAHFAHLGGFLFGYIYMRSKFGLTLPYAFANRLRDLFKKPGRSTRQGTYKYTPIDAQEFIDREVDPILAKISRYGMSSLSRKERRILKKARSQMK
ncbi:rhomboid family intramembrane serine protease [bacterium]|nr:rhomboid family intramembrane serine protease [bacterium]